jgi:hypothetical protein
VCNIFTAFQHLALLEMTNWYYLVKLKANEFKIFEESDILEPDTDKVVVNEGKSNC